jgi:hypothetical protein
MKTDAGTLAHAKPPSPLRLCVRLIGGSPTRPQLPLIRPRFPIDICRVMIIIPMHACDRNPGFSPRPFYHCLFLPFGQRSPHSPDPFLADGSTSLFHTPKSFARRNCIICINYSNTSLPGPYNTNHFCINCALIASPRQSKTLLPRQKLAAIQRPVPAPSQTARRHQIMQPMPSSAAILTPCRLLFTHFVPARLLRKEFCPIGDPQLVTIRPTYEDSAR